MSTRRESRLVTDIAKMIGDQTYNHAPINYGIAERAISIVLRRRVRPLERLLRKVRELHLPATDEHDNTFHWCGHCGLEWPCPTAELIDAG